MLLGVWFIGAPLHWWFIFSLCDWNGSGCGQVLPGQSDSLYRFLLQNGPVAAAFVGLVVLYAWHRRGDDWRMRYAIIGIAQIVIAAAYITAYNWDGLTGSGEASDTVRNIGFAVAAVLTLLFVIWRERIGSNRAEDTRAASLAERYQHGARLLTSHDRIERIAGIYLIQELSRESGSPGRRTPQYREMCLNLLDQWRIHRQAIGASQAELRAVRAAIYNLKNP